MPKTERMYAVVIYTQARGIKSAADAASEQLNAGYTPDAVIPQSAMERLLKLVITSDLESDLCAAIDATMQAHGLDFRTSDTSIAFDLAQDAKGGAA